MGPLRTGILGLAGDRRAMSTTFIAQIRRHAATEREAIRSDTASLSYPELMERVEREAAALAAAGIGPGSIVGLSIADEVEHIVATLALMRTGAWHIALATHDTVTVRLAMATRVHATHIVASADVAALPGIRQLVWPLPAASAALGDSEGGVFLRTSGTTGEMNIVPLTAMDLAIQSARNAEYAGGRLFRPAAIEHNNSRRHRLYCAFMGGTNVVRPPGSFDVVDQCLRHGVTTLDLALMQAADLARSALPGKFPDIDIRVSGSAVPIDTRRQIEDRLTRRLYVRYGSTESGTISSALPGEHDDEETVGRVASGLDLQVVDDDGRPVAAGETGHIRLRGGGITAGYFDGPEQTARRFRDDWYWPGDMGALRPDGSLVVRGRADDMINLNGINIFPAEIERVLERHPDVAVAAALAIESAAHGQIPIAAVELRDGAVATERQLAGYAREHLALRAPRRIVVLDKLPRNSQGKVIRREIAAMIGMRRGTT